jgi:hypothetical protein
MSKKRPPPKSAESLLDGSLDTLRFGLAAIDREIRLIASGKAAENGHDAASRIAYLTQRVGAIADSVRKVEAARAKRLDAITPAAVQAWFRGLPRPEQAGFLRELGELASTRSGLA